MLTYIPLAVGVSIFILLLLPLVSDRAEVVLDGVGQSLFGDTLSKDARRRSQLPEMEAAHIARSHRSFVSQTVLISICAGIASGLISSTLLSLLFSFLEGLTDVTIAGLANLSAGLEDAGLFEFWPQLTAIVFLSGIITLVVAVVANQLRWFIIGQQSYARGSQIDATLPRTVAFMYALSRSGMAYTQVLRTLADNRAVYGEAAVEVDAAVKQMDLFGVDLQTALEDMSDRTPSDNMAELTENLGSVLGSGRSLSDYLRTQYERYKKEAEAQQEQYLSMLATFAEAYVTLLVAGPLFLITTLAVIGLTLQDTLPIMRIITYVGIPLLTFAFVVYVDSVTQTVSNPEKSETENETEDGIIYQASTTGAQAVADGGIAQDKWSLQREKLGLYDRLDQLISWLKQPVEMLLRNPWITLLVTGPAGFAWIVFTIGSFELTPISFIEALAPPLSEALIIVLATYAVVYEIRKRQARSIEVAVPDFLDRFASVNDAGMTIIEGFRRVKNSDLGALTPELKRTWRDIRWGSDAGSALKRMDRRIESPLVTRAVTLSTNAMETSDDIAPVLEIAADEARSSQALNRQRKQAMLTYMIVIYISFFVFLGIIAALVVSFIPAIEEVARETIQNTPDAAQNAGAGLGLLGGMQDLNISGYETLFFHITLVQAICSGLVAGQLGQGTLRDGVKHATILLIIAYVAFLFL
jgi:flagellar protein FlaJ